MKADPSGLRARFEGLRKNVSGMLSYFPFDDDEASKQEWHPSPVTNDTLVDEILQDLDPICALGRAPLAKQILFHDEIDGEDLIECALGLQRALRQFRRTHGLMQRKSAEHWGDRWETLEIWAVLPDVQEQAGLVLVQLELALQKLVPERKLIKPVKSAVSRRRKLRK